jgi:flagellar basal body-associated protein FliL
MSGAEEKSESMPSASSGGGPNKLVLILTAVNVVATLAMVGIMFMSFQKDKGKPSVEDIAVKAHGEAEAGHGDAKKDEGHGGGGEHGGGHGEAKAEKKKSADFGKMVPLEQFTVNLSTPGSVTPKFVRVAVSLEVPNEEAEGEVTGKMPQVRNTIIDLFNSKRPGDMATAEGRDYLKEEIRNAINGFMVTGKVKGVFFTNFALGS